jgi:hypothetical protein
MPTIRELLNTLGFTSGNHDTDVRDALTEMITQRKAAARLVRVDSRRQPDRTLSDTESYCAYTKDGDDFVYEGSLAERTYNEAVREALGIYGEKLVEITIEDGIADTDRVVWERPATPTPTTPASAYPEET